MPLKQGSSRKTVSHNVKEMVGSWKRKGKIGSSRPRSKKKAIKQAVAISLKKAGKSKYQRRNTLSANTDKKQLSKQSPRKRMRLVRGGPSSLSFIQK